MWHGVCGMEVKGGVILDSKVTVADSSTGQTKKVVTAADGRYVWIFLPAVQYSVTFIHPGFKPKSRAANTLTTFQVGTVDISCECGN